MPSTALICAFCNSFRSKKDGDYFVSVACGQSHIVHYFCIRERVKLMGRDARCPKCRKMINMKNLTKISGVSIVQISSRKPSTMKIAMIGSAGVGKSSLVTRYKAGSFSPTSTNNTIGCDMETMTVTISDRIIMLRIWDTAGDERYYSIMPAYLRDVDGILLVYDVTSRRSFQDITDWDKESGLNGSWFKIIETLAPPDVELFLCGNKTDSLESERQVTREEGQALATSMGVGFLETSARDNQNVDAVFKLLATLSMDKLVKNGLVDNYGSNDSLLQYEPPSSSCSC